MANIKRLDQCNDHVIRSYVYYSLLGYICNLADGDWAGTFHVKNLPKLDIEGLTGYLGDYTIESLLLITVGAKTSTPILATSLAPTYCMLMLPIVGISNITVDWFKRSGKAQVVNNELVFNRQQCKVKDSAKLEGTSLVKTFIPFSINNPNPYKSVILAIKFEKEPVQLLDESIFASVVK